MKRPTLNESKETPGKYLLLKKFLKLIDRSWRL